MNSNHARARMVLIAVVGILSIASVAQQPDMSGIWNGAVCKGQGDMIVTKSATLIPVTGYVHMELTPANSGGSDVRYDVDISLYSASGALREHHSIPYEPIHYGHGAQPDSAHPGGWYFQADSRAPDDHSDGRVVSFSFSDQNGTVKASGLYSHYHVSGTSSQDLGVVWIYPEKSNQSIQQYIRTHPHPCQ